MVAIVLAGGAFGYGSWVLLHLQAIDVCGTAVDAGDRFAVNFVGLIWMGVCLVAAAVVAALVDGGGGRAWKIALGVVLLIVVLTGLLQWWNVASFEASCGGAGRYQRP